jgi:hypothetical protein
MAGLSEAKYLRSEASHSSEGFMFVGGSLQGESLSFDTESQDEGLDKP